MVDKCKKCGNKVYIGSPDGLCYNCHNLEEDKKSFELLGGQDYVIFVSKVSKMGPRRIIELPKKQRPFIDDDEIYIVTLETKDHYDQRVTKE